MLIVKKYKQDQLCSNCKNYTAGSKGEFCTLFVNAITGNPVKAAYAREDRKLCGQNAKCFEKQTIEHWDYD